MNISRCVSVHVFACLFELLLFPLCVDKPQMEGRYTPEYIQPSLPGKYGSVYTHSRGLLRYIGTDIQIHRPPVIAHKIYICACVRFHANIQMCQLLAFTCICYLLCGLKAFGILQECLDD